MLKNLISGYGFEIALLRSCGFGVVEGAMCFSSYDEEAMFFWGDAGMLVMHRNCVKASIFGGWTLHIYCKCIVTVCLLMMHGIKHV